MFDVVLVIGFNVWFDVLLVVLVDGELWLLLLLCVSILFVLLFDVLFVVVVMLLIGFEGGLLFDEENVVCVCGFIVLLFGLCVLCIEMVGVVVFVVLVVCWGGW